MPESYGEYLAKQPVIPANPGPSLGVSGEDARDMQRAMKGATTSRAAGMAHQAAEKANAYSHVRQARKEQE